MGVNYRKRTKETDSTIKKISIGYFEAMSGHETYSPGAYIPHD